MTKDHKHDPAQQAEHDAEYEKLHGKKEDSLMAQAATKPEDPAKSLADGKKGHAEAVAQKNGDGVDDEENVP